MGRARTERDNHGRPNKDNSSPWACVRVQMNRHVQTAAHVSPIPLFSRVSQGLRPGVAGSSNTDQRPPAVPPPTTRGACSSGPLRLRESSFLTAIGNASRPFLQTFLLEKFLRWKIESPFDSPDAAGASRKNARLESFDPTNSRRTARSAAVPPFETPAARPFPPLPSIMVYSRCPQPVDNS